MPLVQGVLNVVGENHTESGARRDEEKRFCLAKTGSGDYWLEHEFPDLHQQVSGRARGGQGQGQAQGADLMELRAAHAAALLIAKSEKLTATAARVARITIVLPPGPAADFEGKIRALRQFRDRAASGWRPTRTNELNTAAQAIFTDTENACQAYLDASRTILSEQSAAAQALADGLTAVRNLLTALESAVGVPQSGNGGPNSLALHMQTQRSSFMGLAAGMSSRDGVWKIGDAHINDLKSGRSKIDMSRANFVTKAEFNQEFADWQAQQTT